MIIREYKDNIIQQALRVAYDQTHDQTSISHTDIKYQMSTHTHNSSTKKQERQHTTHTHTHKLPKSLKMHSAMRISRLDLREVV